MKFWKDNIAHSTISFLTLWWIPAIFPLLMVLSAFASQHWSWGLMDDHNMIQIPGNVLERFWHLYDDLLAAGRFYPAFLFHCALFYKLFQQHPLAFFIFRFVEVTFALGLWGYLAFLVTDKKVAAPIFFAVTLSFYKFYDAFFFLSTQEILGVLFSGAAAISFVKLFKEQPQQKWKWIYTCCGILFLLLTFWSKEPFITVSLALGLAMAATWLKHRRNKMLLVYGLSFIILFCCYAAFLKLCISKEYTARYNVSDMGAITYNLTEWFKKDVMAHLPWVIMIVMAIGLHFRIGMLTVSQMLGRYFGIFLYVFYLLIILPWSSWGHYVTPLGVFFGFVTAVLLAHRIELLRPWLVGLFMAISLATNILVGGSAINFHAGYQKDTANLMAWMSQNSLFARDMAEGNNVRCNSDESSVAIPKFLKLTHNKSFSSFIPSAGIKEILTDSKTKYFLYGTTMGDQDLRLLDNYPQYRGMWTPMFVSDHWILFRRMY